MRRRSQLMLVLLPLVAGYIFLSALDGFHYFQAYQWTWHTFLLFSSSTFVAAPCYLIVGGIAWIFLRHRKAALSLLVFCAALTATFSAAPGADINDIALSLISASGCVVAAIAFVFLLLFFPHPYELEEYVQFSSSHQKWYVIGVLMLTIGLAIGALVSNAMLYMLPGCSPSACVSVSWLPPVMAICYALLVVCIIWQMNRLYVRASVRTRQQLHIIFGGCGLALIPFLIMIVPQIFGSSIELSSELLILCFVCVPLSLGFALLRYQLRVKDIELSRFVTVSVQIICFLNSIILCMYLYSLFPQGFLLWAIIFFAGPMPWLLWRVRFITERYFFSDIQYYRRLKKDPHLLNDEKLTLEDISHVLITLLNEAFASPPIALFFLNEGTGTYDLLPALQKDQHAQAVYTLLQSAFQDGAQFTLDSRLPAMQLLHSGKTTMRLSDLLPTHQGKYFLSFQDEDNFLLAPLCAPTKMIGFVALGPRPHKSAYGGPDSEILQLLLEPFRQFCVLSWMDTQESRFIDLVNTLRAVNSMPINTFTTVKDVIEMYAIALALSSAARVEIRSDLCCFAATGDGPCISEELLQQLAGTEAIFYSPLAVPPASLSSWQVPYAFARIPLYIVDQPGFLLLSYQQRHVFLPQERTFLTTFAAHTEKAIYFVQTLQHINAALEEHKRLSWLHNLFSTQAIVASDEPLQKLRTILNEKFYDPTLSAEDRFSLIMTMRELSDELCVKIDAILMNLNEAANAKPGAQ